MDAAVVCVNVAIRFRMKENKLQEADERVETLEIKYLILHPYILH